MLRAKARILLGYALALLREQRVARNAREQYVTCLTT